MTDRQDDSGALREAIKRAKRYAQENDKLRPMLAQTLEELAAFADAALSPQDSEPAPAASAFRRHYSDGACSGWYDARIESDLLAALQSSGQNIEFAYASPAPAQQAEMKALLHSTHAIALRGGADTNWEAMANSIAKLGIGPVTARHYFAEGTTRETINKHLDALLSRINTTAQGDSDA